jgi:hypothetical protein
MLQPKFTYLLLLLLFTQQLFSQSTAAVNKIGAEGFPDGPAHIMEKSALKSKSELDYYAAIKYNELWLKADTTAAALKGYAEAAISFSAFESAEIAYNKLQRLFPNDLDGVTLLNLANTKYHLGKYNDSKGFYQSILERSDVTSANVDKAQNGLEVCDWAMSSQNEPSNSYVIENLGDDINSQYNDFAPYPVGDTLYFSSFRFPFPKDKENPERSLIKVLTNVTTANNQETYPASFNEEKRHTANTTFDASGNLMFYTNCIYANTANIQCELYMRTKSANGTWNNAVRLPDEINVAGYTTTEPSVGYDKISGKQVLYYVSDRSGGKGLRDIWSVKIMENQNFSDPVNLVDINTDGDDVTPFYHNKTSVLYFSSDGYQSLGGKDIYKTKDEGNAFGVPEHLEFPVNSKRHDIYYTLTKDGSIAYLASNREGSRFISDEACCMDIYKVQKPELLVVTFHKETGDSLFATTFQLIELPIAEELKLQVPGSYMNLSVQLKKQYMLIASKEGFMPDTLTFDSPEKMWKGLMVKKLYLKPANVSLITNVFDKNSKAPINGATFQFVDLGYVTSAGSLATGRGNSPLSNESKKIEATNTNTYKLEFNHRYKVIVMKVGMGIDSTNEISTVGYTSTEPIVKNLYLYKSINLETRAYDIITKQPLLGTDIRFIEVETNIKKFGSNSTGNEYKYVIDFERSYWIIISKSGYTSDSILVKTDASNINLSQNQTILRDLYLRPSKLESFLPLSLYFDNDEPDKSTNAYSTRKSYSQTYETYLPRKQEFIIKYFGGKINNESDPSNARIDNFFETDVKGGYNKLLKFSAALKERLFAGDKIEITIKGFASPRAATNYNKNLTSRRISSVRNHFAQFESGLFVKYFNNGQLILREEPNGEDKSPFGISDIIPDERNSVFSVDASLERRVELIEVKVSK